MTIEDMRTKFAELGVVISSDDLESRVKTLTDQFKVLQDDAESSVISYFLRANGIERSDYYAGSGGNKAVSVVDLPHQDGQWVNLRVKLIDIWDTESERILARRSSYCGEMLDSTKWNLASLTYLRML